MTVPASRALEILRGGNQRFVQYLRDGSPTAPHPTELPQQHEPIAAVLCCSDARVPPEIIFDQPAGSLFVGRVAGHVADASQIASIELAAERFGSRLVLVLGHQGCAAVLAGVLRALEKNERLPTDDAGSPHLDSILDQIQPSVEPLLGTELRQDTDALVGHALRDHVTNTVKQLRDESPILSNLAFQDGLQIVGAIYSIESGEVEFLDTRV